MNYDPLAFLREDSWRDGAVCASIDGDLWFPEVGGPTRALKRICHTCPVRADCLTFALDTGQRYGVWAGYTDHELQRIRRDGDERASIFAYLRGAA